MPGVLGRNIVLGVGRVSQSHKADQNAWGYLGRKSHIALDCFEHALKAFNDIV